jgi:hypothetical protein
MKRIFLSALGLLALIQSHAQTPEDSSAYKSRKLKMEEINLVSSFYNQNGNNSAVTGGIGTEKLSDIANVIDVKFIRYDKKYRRHTLDAEIGIDHYTSASSDLVDLKANSSASHADTRIYPSVSYSIENEKKGTTIGIGASSSTEYDYQSFGGNINFSKKTADKNGEFTAKMQVYLDQVSLILPVELRNSTNARNNNYPATARNTFAGSLSYSQVINDRFQAAIFADLIQQNGYLSLPFHRVYYKDGSVHQENLPSSRFKIPIALRSSYFLGDYIILKGYYRYYNDDWGVKAHTAEIEIPVKITPFFSVSPFYRYYTQTAAKYFGAYKTFTANDQYHTSNYDLSKFSSNFFGAGFKFNPLKGVLGLKRINSAEIRYGHYSKNINMNANIISLHLKFK